MAFSTIQGSGGAPDSFVGTSGVDAIAIANSTGNFFLGAEQADDNIQIVNSGSALYSGVLASATLKGGQGDDTFTIGTAANATIFTGILLNGNADRDTITFQATDTAIASSIQGGAANDTITAGILTTSLVNGNKGVDTITLNGAVTSSSVYGGGGNDIFTDGNVANTSSLISGNDGNDSITLGNGGASIDALTVTGGAGVDTITLGNSGAAANDDIYINGNDGADTLTGTSVAVTEITLEGGEGNDTINSGAGTTTAVGGQGSDTMQAGAGANTFLYTSDDQGGASDSATSTSVIAAGDIIGSTTAFTSLTDRITFVSADTLTGSSASVASGAANNWNLNTAGVFRVTGSTLVYTAGTTTYAAAAAAVGTVVGDAGDTAYFAIQDSATATQTLIFQVTLGTTRAVGAGTALNAGDTISLVSDVTEAAGFLAAADFTFV